MKIYKTCISGLIAAAFLSAPQAYADKSDETVVITFAREVTDLDYNHGTRTEFIILGELIDETTADFTLREDVTFHDGSAFTVEDEENFRHTKVSVWFESIEKTGPLSVRFNEKYAYANFFYDLYRVRIRKKTVLWGNLVPMIPPSRRRL